MLKGCFPVKEEYGSFWEAGSLCSQSPPVLEPLQGSNTRIIILSAGRFQIVSLICLLGAEFPLNHPKRNGLEPKCDGQSTAVCWLSPGCPPHCSLLCRRGKKTLSHFLTQLLHSVFYLSLNRLSQTLPALLMGSAMASAGSVLEPALSNMDTASGLFSQRKSNTRAYYGDRFGAKFD